MRLRYGRAAPDPRAELRPRTARPVRDLGPESSDKAGHDRRHVDESSARAVDPLVHRPAPTNRDYQSTTDLIRTSHELTTVIAVFRP